MVPSGWAVKRVCADRMEGDEALSGTSLSVAEGSGESLQEDNRSTSGGQVV
jgi:hypothetical protein